MMQKLMIAILLAMPLGASAANKNKGQDKSEASPVVQWTHDSNYIYRKQPWHVTLDADQRASLTKGASFISGQLQNLSANNELDPSGDLAAVNAGVEVLNSKLNQLVGAAGKLYGDVASSGFSRYDGLPTGIILFGGIEYDKSVMKFVTGGGSVMLGLVLVPMSVERTDIRTREVVKYTEWSSSLILIPTANAGPGISSSASANGSNRRYGAGLVWGTLNKASELVGLTYGPSTTLALGEGLNVKALVLKNFAKEGAVNNVIVLAGVEKGTLAAETHLNIGGIFDASSFLQGVVNTGSGVVQWVQGKVGVGADQ